MLLLLSGWLLIVHFSTPALQRLSCVSVLLPPLLVLPGTTILPLALLRLLLSGTTKQRLLLMTLMLSGTTKLPPLLLGLLLSGTTNAPRPPPPSIPM